MPHPIVFIFMVVLAITASLRLRADGGGSNTAAGADAGSSLRGDVVRIDRTGSKP